MSVSRTLSLLVLLLSLACSSVRKSTGDNSTLQASALQPVGRYYFDAANNLGLVSTACHVSFSFRGASCNLYVSLPGQNQHNYIQYEIDGIYRENVRVEGSSNQPITIKADGAGTHIVCLYKTTEAHSGTIFINKITGDHLQPVQPQKVPVIEFIGNSITCGAAADASVTPCNMGDYHDHHNAYYAYGPRVSRALHTQFLVTSVSGIGIYRNWNSDGPTMPQVYDKTDFQEGSAMLWDFTNYSPRIVSIALGTNDFSNGDGKRKRLPFDSAAFVNNYIGFVKHVKSKYPSAQIALLSSPMVSGQNRELLQNCISTVKRAIDAAYPTNKKVATFFFEPMQPHGCSGHPSVEDHALLADELTPFFKKLL